MYVTQGQHGNARRRKKRHVQGLRTVDVVRGRSGYGFTISGQHPCVLSCIVAGSPADRVGLKTGDLLLAVNGMDVSQASHDDVVRLVGSSTGCLTVQIAENLNNSSDSSGDEEQQHQRPRPKAKYPSRARAKQGRHHVGAAVDDAMVAYGGGRDRNGAGGGGGGHGHGRHGGKARRDMSEQGRLRALSPGREWERHREHQHFANPARPRGIENVDPSQLHGGQGSKRYKHQQQQPHHHHQQQQLVTQNEGVIRYRSPNTKHTIITREARLGLPRARSPSPGRQTPPPPPLPARGPAAAGPLRGKYGPRPRVEHGPVGDSYGRDESFMLMDDYLRVIVGYIGSIEMPRDTKKASARLQSIRGAVRRLRLERKIHTMVLMEVAAGGVRLLNAMGSTVAHYAAHMIVFSGVSPDDKRFFGIVTLHGADDDFAANDSLPPDAEMESSSCHVFMVDPELCSHSLHVHKARNFGIHCTLHPDTQLCLEFPTSALPVIRCMAHLYRDRPSAIYETEMAQIGAFAVPSFAPPPPHRPPSVTSVSSDVSQGGVGEDRVCVVELPHNTTQQSEASLQLSLDHDHDDHVPLAGSYLPAARQERYPSPGAAGAVTLDPSPIPAVLPSETPRGSREGALPTMMPTLERLKVRAMPDPRLARAPSRPDGRRLEEQNSADNIRRSIHRVMWGRQSLVDTPGGDDELSAEPTDQLSLAGGVGHLMAPPRPPTDASPPSLQYFTPQGQSQAATHVLPCPAPNKLSASQLPLTTKGAPGGFVTPLNPPQGGAIASAGPSIRASFDSSLTDSVASSVGRGPPDASLTSVSSFSSRNASHSISSACDTSRPSARDSLGPRTSGNGAAQPALGVTAGTSHGRLNSHDAPPEAGSSTPALPSVTPHKPPVPERKPMASRRDPKTPIKPPKINFKRPKSTPPFKRNPVNTAETPADQDGYDSDPGGAACPEEGPAKKPEVPAPEVPAPVLSALQDRERRFSEGGVTSRLKEATAAVKKGGSFKHLKGLLRRNTLTGSHESLVVSDADNHKTGVKLLAASSITSLTSGGATRTASEADDREGGAGRAAGWAVNFDRLLRDDVGLATFTEFLKKEFSEENIIFWKKCEEFKKITDICQRKSTAQEIFDCHLVACAGEAVNVDSAASKAAERGLQGAQLELFDDAQTQIFRLMKQDSYVRFLKSEQYKACVVAEMEGRSVTAPAASDGGLPTEANHNNNSTHSTPGKKRDRMMKKSKSSSTAEDVVEEKRRRSLLPWSKNKSEKRLSKQLTATDLKQAAVNVMLPPASPRAALPPREKSNMALADLSVLSKEIHSAVEEVEPREVAGQDRQRLCRVMLPDGSTTVISAKAGQTIREAISRLCERRHINMAMLEVKEAGAERPLDLSRDLSVLGSKEIVLDKRVLFRVDLPNRKPVAVRAKPGRTIQDVFAPILLKHGHRLDANTVVHVAGTGVILNEDQDVATLDNKQVIVQSLDDFKGKRRREWGSFGSHRGLSSKPPIPRLKLDPYKQGKTLEDIVSNLLKDVLEGQNVTLEPGSVVFDNLGCWEYQKPKHDNEHRNSGIFGFMRKSSFGEKDGAKLKQKARSMLGSQKNGGRLGGSTSSLQTAVQAPPAHPVGAGRGRRLSADDEKFLGMLSRAQSRQMDDQRGGLSNKGLELPDFLRKDSQGSRDSMTSSDRSSSGSSVLQRQLSDSSLYSVNKSHLRAHSDVGYHDDSFNPPAVDSPSSGRIPFMDESFGHDGTMPTPNRATNYFSQQACEWPQTPNFEDSHLMEGSLRDIGMGSSFISDGGKYDSLFRQHANASMASELSWDMSAGVGSHGGLAERAIAAPPRQQQQPMVPRRQNPPGKDGGEGAPTAAAGQGRDGTDNAGARSEDEADITLIPPSDTSEEDGEGETGAGVQLAGLPTPPGLPHNGSLEHTAQADYPPPTPLTNATQTTTSSTLTIQLRSHLVISNDNEVENICSESTNQGARGKSVRSAGSTPSPTTHDLVLDPEDSSDSSARGAPEPAPRGPSIRDPSRSKVKKSLVFDPSEAKGDMQVSFV